MRSAYAAGVGARDLLQRQLETKEAELTRAREDIAVWEQVQFLFAKVSEYAREQLKARIEETVTAALVTVFGEGYFFRINLRTMGGQPAAEWQVISQYGDFEVAASPEDARGGGITDVVSLALRLAMLELVRPKPGGPVILDEPAKMVSAEYAGNLAYFLKQYAARTGRQVIMVTHNAQLAEVADKSYLVTQVNGVSEVKAI
jgi:DNA repair exonuclease SbcCD ATPase subunit